MELAVFLLLVFGLPLTKSSSQEARFIKKGLIWLGIIALQYMIVFGAL